MDISVIIPTWNEASSIVALIDHLKKSKSTRPDEIIVSDGGSKDATVQLAESAGAKVLISPRKGRSAQMNHGASVATGDILYFVHADTFPPASYTAEINSAVNAGYNAGRYKTRFDSNNALLRLNALFTALDLFVCYGGDQTFFITKDLFSRIGGFREDMSIMEDYDITVRAKANGRYKILPGYALISARKYETNSWFKVQKANYTIVKMYRNGASQSEMVKRYKELLNYR